MIGVVVRGSALSEFEAAPAARSYQEQRKRPRREGSVAGDDTVVES